MIGKSVLHYKVLSKLGEGGMGVVYKAQDTKLDREVALKFLPTNSMASQEEKTRFQQEAKAAAKLNHANIAHVYEINEHDNQLFIAMEYVDGETLSEMTAKGPLKLEEAVKIATQIADGLQAAHEKKITHRDIKSQNIMLNSKGVVKIMDFGLAKLSGRTMVTKEGTTLGTASYMSPEQARGESADHRSDIWSLGVILYEMISGQLPFKGDYEQAVVYAILNEDPEPLTALRSGLPIALDGIIAKTLAKDRDIRYQHVDELPADLKAIDTGASHISRVVSATNVSAVPPSAIAQSSGSGHNWRLLLPMASLIALVAFASAWFLKPGSERLSTDVQYLSISPSQDEGIQIFDVSADGRHFAYIGLDEGNISRIFYRHRNEFKAAPLQGTEGVKNLDVSHDGRWITFVANHKLKKILTAGGSPTVVADLFNWEYRGVSWLADTVIVGSNGSGLKWVPAQGGALQDLTVLDTETRERSHERPHLLPDGRHLLFTIVRETGEINIGLLSLASKERRILISEGGFAPRYIATGHILFNRSGILMAVPFDLERLEVTGSEHPTLEDIQKGVVTDDGSLYFMPLRAKIPDRLVWVDRGGQEESELVQGYRLVWPRISPTEDRIAYGLESDDQQQIDIWIYDLARKSSSRVTLGGLNGEPEWTPDGKKLVFWSLRSGANPLVWKSADGSGPAEVLQDEVKRSYPGSWSPDGQTFAFYGSKDFGQNDIWLLQVDGKPEAKIKSKFEERLPSISPNGRWLAFVSDQSGRNEVYVQPFPKFDKLWQISTNGGNEPTWSGDSKTMYFRNGYRMMMVPIRADPEFRAGEPRLLFEKEYMVHGFSDQNYDVSRDGQHFAMIKSDETTGQIHVVLNWIEAFKQKMADGRND